MEQMFEVGGSYKNRKGEYKVLKICDDKMIIQFLDGEIVNTTVERQISIWKNMKIDESIHESIDVGEKHPPKKGKKQLGKNFQGLEENDFKEGVTGTSWRAKTGLGGLLVMQLLEGTQEEWRSYPVYRRAEVYIAQTEINKKEIGVRKAKLYFKLSETEARYGFCIEKNDESMDESWDWLRFMNKMEKDDLLCRKIDHAIRKYNLEWEAYLWNKHEEGGLAMSVRVTDEGLMMSHFLENWDAEFTCKRFFSALSSIDNQAWCDLYLLSKNEKKLAIEQGVGIASSATDIYQALMPLYKACINE